MRLVVQRVSEARVLVEGNVVGEISRGAVALLGVAATDGDKEIEWIANKLANLRIFEDAEGKMNLSSVDVGGELLVVSNFTLYGDVQRGFRPSFTQAAAPELAEPIYDKFVERMRKTGLKIETGVFGAMMRLEIMGDGPVTILVESK